MKKIVGIVIIIVSFMSFGSCTADDIDRDDSTRDQVYAMFDDEVDETPDEEKELLESVFVSSIYNGELDKLNNNKNKCSTQISEGTFAENCDIDTISGVLQQTLKCFSNITFTDNKTLKQYRDNCINAFEHGELGLTSLQETYDQLYSGLIQSEQSFFDGTHMYQDKLDDYKSSTLNKIDELESYNNRIQELKQNIQQCKQYYNDIQDIQKDIKNTIGDIEKQQKSLTKAENKNQKKKDKNSNQEARKLGTTSESVEKAENKRKENDEKADYVLNQACLSARDFLYTLKYGTTMKEGNPGNDLIENRSPREMLDKVVYDANAIDQYQETAMDGVTSRDESCVNGGGRITNTLCWVKNHIHPYIQWIVYLGLTLSVILLIYNGFKMVTNVMHGEGDFGKIKTNILYIGLGIIILTGFYYLLDIVMAIINFLFD